MTLIMQNKPNMLDTKMNVNEVLIRNYEDFRPFCPRKNKPNSNPNDQTFMAKYATFRPKRLSYVPKGTKPNQTQFSLFLCCATGLFSQIRLRCIAAELAFSPACPEFIEGSNVEGEYTI